MDYTVGFTGTQEGMNADQLETLEKQLRDIFEWNRERGWRSVFREGDCVGADRQAAETAYWLKYYIIAHPSTIMSKRAFAAAHEYLIPQDPLAVWEVG